ncbi:MAG: LamG-like jellyroll fold domain-containing protein [Candidatus Binatia bacterium]
MLMPILPPLIRAGSLSLAGASTQYLSMSNANWGAYDRAMFAIAGSIKPVGVASSQYIITKGNNAAGTVREWMVNIQSDGALRFIRWDANDNSLSLNTGASTLTAGAWNAFLIHYDYDGTAMEIWINGTSLDSDIAGAVVLRTSTTDVRIGVRGDSSGNPDDPYDGLINNLAFFSGSLPAAGDVFDGTSGKLKDLTGLAGLYSLLDVAGGSPVSDYVKATDWTNTNGVTTSADAPA